KKYYKNFFLSVTCDNELWVSLYKMIYSFTSAGTIRASKMYTQKFLKTIQLLIVILIITICSITSADEMLEVEGDDSWNHSKFGAYFVINFIHNFCLFLF